MSPSSRCYTSCLCRSSHLFHCCAGLTGHDSQTVCERAREEEGRKVGGGYGWGHQWEAAKESGTTAVQSPRREIGVKLRVKSAWFGVGEGWMLYDTQVWYDLFRSRFYDSDSRFMIGTSFLYDSKGSPSTSRGYIVEGHVVLAGCQCSSVTCVPSSVGSEIWGVSNVGDILSRHWTSKWPVLDQHITMAVDANFRSIPTTAIARTRTLEDRPPHYECNMSAGKQGFRGTWACLSRSVLEQRLSPW